MRYVLAALAAIVFTLPASAQESRTLTKIKETGAIAIGYREASIPFSYLDGDQKPVGFAMDICLKIAEAVKTELKLSKLEIKLQPVTTAARIPLIANGTIDLECGSTTNNAERQNQVWFTNTYFLTAAKYVTKIASGIKKIDDLKGKTITSTSGSTNIKQITELNAAKNLGLTIIPVKDVAEGFLMMDTDRAVAFFNDDIVLSGLVAVAKDPKLYVVSEDATSLPEPYSAIVPKDDVPFKKIADAATKAFYTSPDFPKVYAKWFQSPIPPKNINLNLPMSAAMKKAYANPTDNWDPKAY